jgi:hypothetical protein
MVAISRRGRWTESSARYRDVDHLPILGITERSLLRADLTANQLAGVIVACGH